MSVKPNYLYPYKSFNLKPFPSSKRSVEIRRPIIPVTVIYGKRLVQFEALLDSGADYNIFPGDIAIYLGINLKQGSKRNIHGISGNSINGYQHQVKLKIADQIYRTSITFSNNLPENALAVLGNIGFFDHFSVLFDYKEGQVTLWTKN